jgi:uncharacterized membrane protein (UPF0127 family)
VGNGARLGFDERRTHRLLGWTIGIVLAAGVLSFIAKGADGPPNPYVRAEAAVTSVPSTVPVRVPVPGFGEIAFRIGSGPQQCGLLADTPAQQQLGLMRRTDLAGHTGMVFRFRTVTTTSFFMRNTPLPLSIAWFDANGGFISSADMAPCPDRPDCQQYFAARPYRYALEVPKGALAGLGVGPGAHLALGAGC